MQQRSRWLQVLRSVRLVVLFFACACFANRAQAAPIVVFSWSPSSSLLQAGTAEIVVDLLAEQRDGADAAFLTLGFATAGAITGVQLVAYGAAVSASDSFFIDVAGQPALLASAPASPGSFGEDVDFLVATLRIAIDPLAAAGTGGSLSLVDLSAAAGPPALRSDGVTAIEADWSTPFSIRLVPAPGGLGLLGVGVALLAARRASWAAAPLRS